MRVLAPEGGLKPPEVAPGYDPLELARAVREKVVREGPRGEERRYYRFRGGRWYGGIATGDVVGCNLRCGFCWSWRQASHLMAEGRFCAPEEVFRELVSIARRRGYRLVRLSGGEPTLSMSHVLELLDLFDRTRYWFVLETNGIILGAHAEYAEELAEHPRLVVRVSLKGTNEEEFHALTLAKPAFFDYQLRALENLVQAGLEPGERVYAAVMLSFSEPDSYEELRSRLAEIHPALAEEVDEEFVILYPHVVELLRRRKLRPKIAFRPDGIPSSMI